MSDITTIKENTVLTETDITAGDIVVEEGAQLDLVLLQAEDHASKEKIIKNITLQSNTAVRVFTGLFGSVDLEVHAHLEGNHAGFDHHLLYIGSEKQQIDMDLIATHTGKRTLSRTITRGVAIDNAHVNFAGNIIIEQSGTATDGHLEHEGLLMSTKAHIDALPGLEIATDDVKASHSSAVHYIKDDQIFYLQSRGIEPLEARKMIIAGFLAEILTAVQEPGMLQTIESIVEDRKERINA